MKTIILYLSYQPTATSVNIEHLKQDALTPNEQNIVATWQRPDTIIQVVGYKNKVIYSGDYATIVRQIRERSTLRRSSRQPVFINPTPPVRG